MGTLKETDSSKWINTLIVIAAALVGYISIALFNQLNEWFELEARIPNFQMVAQVAGIVLGASTFLFVLKNKDSSQYLKEVYGELTKVIWPDKDSTVKLTVTIVISVTIAAVFLSLADLGITELLDLLY